MAVRERGKGCQLGGEQLLVVVNENTFVDTVIWNDRNSSSASVSRLPVTACATRLCRDHADRRREIPLRWIETMATTHGDVEAESREDHLVLNNNQRLRSTRAGNMWVTTKITRAEEIN